MNRLTCDRCGNQITYKCGEVPVILHSYRMKDYVLFNLCDLCSDCKDKLKRFLEDEVELVDEKELN